MYFPFGDSCMYSGSGGFLFRWQ